MKKMKTKPTSMLGFNTLAYHKLPDFFTTYRIYMKNSKFYTHVKNFFVLIN